jgi:hypothetical protein
MFRGSCFIGKSVELCQLLYIREPYEFFVEPTFYSSNEDIIMWAVHRISGSSSEREREIWIALWMGKEVWDSAVQTDCCCLSWYEQIAEWSLRIVGRCRILEKVDDVGEEGDDGYDDDNYSNNNNNNMLKYKFCFFKRNN